MMILILLGIFFVMSVQPMLMIISLILISLLYSVYIYMIMGGYWFSYALLMVMLSGVLVVFTYMVSLIPNESFEVFNLIIIVFFMLTFMLMVYEKYGMDFSYMSLNLWMLYVGIFNLFLVSFLLSIMIMVVWISNLSEGAVRIG